MPGQLINPKISLSVWLPEIAICQVMMGGELWAGIAAGSGGKAEVERSLLQTALCPWFYFSAAFEGHSN